MTLLGMVAAAVLIFTALAIFSPAKKPVQPLSTAGGMWLINDINWRSVGGMWSAPVTLSPGESAQNPIQPDELLGNFCDAVLEALPGAPAAVTRKKVYRLDFNVFAPEENSYLFPDYVPVAVDKGECRVAQYSGQYFRTFPGDLSPWYLHGLNMQQRDGQKDIQTLIFRPRPDRDANMSAFPFLLACQTVIIEDQNGNESGTISSKLGLQEGPVSVIVQSSAAAEKYEAKEFWVDGYECRAPK